MTEIMENHKEINFFSESGIVYLAIDEPDSKVNQVLESPLELDSIDAGIVQARKKLSLSTIEHKEIFDNIFTLLSDLYQTTKQSIQNQSGKLLTQFVAKKYNVKISGEYLEFNSDIDYDIGVSKKITIVMTEYPYETVSSEAIIVNCKNDSEASNSYKVLVKFDQLSSEKEDLLVKFVNSLQRKKIIADREKQTIKK